MGIYLDHASTTPLSDSVKKIIYENLETFGNPSSLHRLGVASERKIKSARRIICEALRIKEKELLFTSGGTEANNLAILGSAARKTGRFITSRIEHPSVLNAFEMLSSAGHEVIYLDVDARGIVDINALESALSEETQLVSIMAVNNEMGSIQPIEAIGQMIHAFNKKHQSRIRFHVDAVQAFGKLPIHLDKAHIDLMSISAHKLNALKGTGGLIVRDGISLKPQQFGGQQEQGIRPGTENLLGILAFGEAVKDAFAGMDLHHRNAVENRSLLIEQLGADSKNHVNGMVDGNLDEYLSNHSPYIVNVGFEGVKGEVLLHALEMKGIFVSTGSACSSKKKTYSHVLKSLGLNDNLLEGSVRFSFGQSTGEDDLKTATHEIMKTVGELRLIMGKKRK